MTVKPILALLIFTITMMSCGKKNTPDPPVLPDGPSTQIENTYGFGVMNKIKGIWDGPVTSSTPLGGYPLWIVDFRPISESQISAKNELDPLNDIFMSFFVAKYDNEYRIAFRNGGSFNGNKRVSYFLCDSVSELPTQSYYRFSEIMKGTKRAYTEVIFRADSMYLKSYTNQYNSQPSATPHMEWRAKLKDQSSCADAVTHFGFPKKVLTKDLSPSFIGKTETIFYSTSSVPSGDPYPETDQPYLGQANISYTYASGFTPDPSKKVLLMISTQPLISGFTINNNNLNTRSRYITLSATDQNYNFNYMHPGTYYLYAMYDNDGNYNYSSGDWVSTTNTSFTLSPDGTTSASTQINFTIP